MPELSCPNCGGTGRIPRDKIGTRLVCKKCHIVFHMTPSGRTVLGEPPPDLVKLDRTSSSGAAAATKPKVDWQEKLPEFSVDRRSALIAGGVVAALVVGYFVMNMAPERLEDRAKVVAQAFANDDLSSLKSYALPSTVDEVVQWYGVAHPLLEERKKVWAGKEVIAGVLVIEEDRRQRNGQVTAFLAPAKSTTRAESIATTADASDMARKPVEVTLFFTPDSWGKWRFDGKKTYQAAPRTVQ